MHLGGHWLPLLSAERSAIYRLIKRPENPLNLRAVEFFLKKHISLASCSVSSAARGTLQCDVVERASFTAPAILTAPSLPASASWFAKRRTEFMASWSLGSLPALTFPPRIDLPEGFADRLEGTELGRRNRDRRETLLPTRRGRKRVSRAAGESGKARTGDHGVSTQLPGNHGWMGVAGRLGAHGNGEAGRRRREPCRVWAPGCGQKRWEIVGRAARREARTTRTAQPQDGSARAGVGARWARVGTHLGLLLGKAGLGRDEAQRGGIRVLVDLVEVVLQDLHLVLRGAGRGFRRHGPCALLGGEKRQR